MRFVNKKRLNDSDGAELAAATVGIATTVYSETIKLEKNLGYNGLLVVGTGGMAITYEVSFDGGTTFYPPYDTDGSLIDNIIAAWDGSQNAIVFEPVLNIHMRIKFVGGVGASSITVDHIYAEED